MTKAHANLARIALLSPLVFGCHGALVGGECLPGFEEQDGRCVVAASGGAGGASAGGNGGAGGSTSTSTPITTSTSTSSPTSTSSASPDATSTSTGEPSTGTGGIVCGALTACASECIDVTSNPDHCGACNRYCPSGICVDGACEGAPGGHGVFVGFDYGHGQSLMPRVILKNALSLSGRDPLRVLDVCSADAGQVCDTTRAFVTQLANEAGKSIVLTPRSLIGVGNEPAALNGMDVLIVHHVMRDEVIHVDGILPLEDTLQSFASSGRTVILMGSETYTDGIAELMVRSRFLPSSGHTMAHGNASVVDFFDALASSVVSPFLQAGDAVSLDIDTSEDPFVRVVATNDAGAVVVHRVFPPAP